ncbi:NUDIX hydrolase [Flaviflexus equikiangi]|uniref:NUDIX domain-containing protein n=1 Tax=Flaviflexus equikiangi TaxID=2758573 RepID=A0ABS2TIL7_9ACTO|nr:NUDIX domain-containing protein [Flaviflexus equikiangi]MBM9434137.1 NUDIX domain-containing protein [Flaviflexus equikiangi]
MLNSVLAHLQTYQPADPAQQRLRDHYLATIDSAMIWKETGPQHVTASTFVFTPDLRRILLTYHRKGRFWVQFGGHLEKSDHSLDAAALREAREESGMVDLELTGGVVDLDRHDLHGGFTCQAHWDVGFTAIVDPDTPIIVSDESDDVAWWPINALPTDATPDLPSRIARAQASLGR